MWGPVRFALAAMSGVLMVVLVVSFGREIDRGSISLAECVQDPGRCEGRELYLGYARVVEADEDAVQLRSWMGPVLVDPWPEETPLPWPGLSVSVIGTYAGDRTVRPNQVQQHPYRWLKEATGAVMLIAWFGGLALWTIRRWREASDA